MNAFVHFAVFAVVVFLQLFACTAVKLPAKPNKPSKAAATVQRRDGGGSGYVDFGAHTGPLGSYGWYADFPANRN